MIAHKKLAELEHNGLVQGIITTNIDLFAYFGWFSKCG